MKNMGHIYTFYCFMLYTIYSDYSYTNCICPYAYIYTYIAVEILIWSGMLGWWGKGAFFGPLIE
ncbi:unnamed protein product [Brassica rapa subsp. trilocularis]|uniref:(rape) hypothetical protein n=1 Tax=Brassica napus TaxID=3708 RepID=A0A817ALI0_BRANA|nr:unnamed protein product [Brassica napus]